MTLKTFDEILLWERSTNDTIDFKKIYVDIAGGDVVAGLMLSEIMYWYIPSKDGRHKLRVHHEDQEWIAVRRYEWWDRARLSPRQVDRAIGLLVSSGVLIKNVYKFNGEPTMHIRIDKNCFTQKMNHYVENPAINPFLPKGDTGITKTKEPFSRIGENQITKLGNSLSPIRENDVADSIIPVTETTTQNTTETTEKESSNAVTEEQKFDSESNRVAISDFSPIATFDAWNDEDSVRDSQEEEKKPLSIVIAHTYPERVSWPTESMERQLSNQIAVSVNHELVCFPSPHELYESDGLFKKFVADAILDEKKYAGKNGYTSRSKIVKRICSYGWPQNGWLAYEKIHREKYLMDLEPDYAPEGYR